jgi:hypothetical protein
MKITKVVITVPYLEGSPESKSFLDNVGRFVADSSEPGMTVKVCQECANCGAINDTVNMVQVMHGKRIKLCDYCYITYEG